MLGLTVDFNDTTITAEGLACLSAAAPDVPPSHCSPDWDRLLCWPPAPLGTLARLPCFSDLNGVQYDTSKNATRWCSADGVWADYTDYSACQPVPAPDSGLPSLLDPVELTAILYFTGYTLSLLALTLALVIFLYFKDLRCLRNTIHINLMVTYMLSDTVWILTHPIQMYQSNQGHQGQECTLTILTLNIVLHYLYLTNFFWMFVEGLYLYMLVVKTFARQDLGLRAYAAIGWGTPLAVVLGWTVAKSMFTPDTVTTEVDGSLEARLISAMLPQCSLLVPDLYDWIYQGPMLVVLLLNIFFLSSIMWVLITKLRSATNAETQQYRKASKALLVLIPLLGVTYLLFLDAPTHHSVYHNIRAALLSVQGLLVALLYCFLNSEVQTTLRHHLAQWKESRDLGPARRHRQSSAAENIRLFNPSRFFKRTRQMSMSEATTMTMLGQSRLSDAL